jgi:chromosomal replication initiation ATPase DnaA
METNIRELKGALNQVIAVHQITGEQITQEMVSRVISNLYEKV